MFSNTVYALDPVIDNEKRKRHDKGQEQRQKRAIEEKGALELKVSIESVIIPKIVELERGYLKSCNIISRPRLPRDFGISSEIAPGMYDVIKIQIYEQQAKINAPVPNNRKVQAYKNCMALYGAIIAQSHINLSEILPSGSISFEDLKSLARIAVEKTIHQRINNRNIKRLYNIVRNDTAPCRFNGSLYQFKCGASLIDISSQQMRLGNVVLFGEKFFGYTGSYTVSQSSSKTKEHVASQKRAWEIVKSGKATVSPSKLIPGL
jgi:hypothetical protein